MKQNDNTEVCQQRIQLKREALVTVVILSRLNRINILRIPWFTTISVNEGRNISEPETRVAVLNMVPSWILQKIRGNIADSKILL